MKADINDIKFKHMLHYKTSLPRDLLTKFQKQIYSLPLFSNKDSTELKLSIKATPKKKKNENITPLLKLKKKDHLNNTSNLKEHISFKHLGYNENL